MTAKSQQFLNELALFYRNKGQLGVNSHHFIARLNGEPVNLWDLYSCVLEMGGSLKVNLASQWDEVYCKLFKTPPVGVNVSVALRQIYQRYLMPYEKVNYSNFSNGLLDDDDEETISANKEQTSNFVIHSSFTNPQQQQSIGCGSANPLNKLFCSLLCGLPNEIELGLKVVSVLSNSKEADWVADFKFIDVLLECYASYSCVCDEETSDTVHRRAETSKTDTIVHQTENCYCVERFWAELCPENAALELVFDSTDLNRIGKHNPHLHQKIYNRVRRIAELIKNITFTIEEHQPVKSDEDVVGSNYFNCATLSLLKFLLLLLTCEDQSFKNIGFDILSNIACFTNLDNDNRQYLLIRETIYRLCVDAVLNSNDLYTLTRSLEALSKLISGTIEETNCSSVLQMLDTELCKRLTELLTCQHDVPLVVASLECCLALSQQYPKILLSHDRNLIKILLNLLNCESSHHFAELALKKVKITDERPQKHSTDLVNASSPVPLSGLPNKAAGQSSLDNETFAMNWLKSSFEAKVPATKSPLRVSDLYADYVKHCCRCGRRNVIGAQPFSQIIKRCFPSCVITQNSLVEGLVVKPQAVVVKPQPQLASPILKAHLSAPPKPSAVTTASSSTSNTPTSTTASTTSPTTTTSTLIKNLLANKLRSNSVSVASTTPATAPATSIRTANVIATSSITSNAETVGTVKSSVIACNPSNNLVKPSTPSAVLTTSSVVSTDAVGITKLPVHATAVQISAAAASSSTVSATNSIPVLVTNSNGHISASSSTSSSTQSYSSASCGTPMSTPPQSLTNSPVLIGAPQVAAPTSLQSQQPQQFLLVRTIFTSPQQQGLVGVPSAGTPVRLILPANVFNQQRPITSSITMNGISAATNQTAPPSTSTQSTTSTAMSSTNDILLKAVLGSGIGIEPPPAPPSPVRTNAVKSSPLLNVLLDKGKLPEFSTIATASGPQTSTNSTSVTTLTTTSVTCVPVTSVVTQQPKMFILTTKSPLAIKNLPGIQQGQLQNQQVSQIQHLQQPVVMQQSHPMQQPLSIQNVQQLPLQPSQPPQPNNVQPQTLQPSTSSQHLPTTTLMQNQTQASPQLQQLPSQLLANSTQNVNSLQVSIPEPSNGKGKPTQINSSEIISNGEISMDSSPVEAGKSMPTGTTDLSPIKDIRKTVDDATKLINKRPNEDNTAVASHKKTKTNATINSVCNTGIKSSVAVKGVKTYSSNHVKNVAGAESAKMSTTSTNSSASTASATLASSTSAADVKKAEDASATATSSPACSSSTKKVATAAKQLEFVCDWHGCKKTFTRPSKVYLHVHEVHVNDKVAGTMTCQWGGPEGLGPGCQSLRPKLSLLTHLQDFHCNPTALHQAALRNQQLTNTGSTTVSLPQPPPAHPGYAHNAALLAIKRHAINYVEPPAAPQITPTTPLTVNIRLTAALILRNLCSHSCFIRKTLQCYESFLSELCIVEGRDESRTIAQCLAVIIDGKGSGN